MKTIISLLAHWSLMKTYLGRFALIGFSTALFGCDNILLNANFDQYSQDTETNLEFFELGAIPGEPEGDHYGQIHPLVVATNTPPPAFSSNAMRVNGLIEMAPRDHDVPERYEIRFTGLRTNNLPIDTVISFVNQLGTNEETALQLVFNEGFFTVVAGDNSDHPERTYSLTEAHSVAITMNMGAARPLSIEIMEGDEQFLLINNFHFLDSGFNRLGGIIVESSTSSPYFMDNLLVVGH